MDLSALNPVEQATIYVNHIQTAQADALNATLRAARAKAAGNAEQAAAEKKVAEEALAGVAALQKEIPKDVQQIVDAQFALRRKEAEAQHEAAARVLVEDAEKKTK